MNYFSIIIFLGTLSILNLFILISLQILGFANATSKQKIICVRTGLIIICLAMLIFYISQLFSFHTLEIILPYNLINQLPSNSIISLTNQSSINWSFYIFIAYTVGFLIMLFRILLSYLKSYKQLSCSTQCNIQGQTVFLNENILSPLSFGFPK